MDLFINHLDKKFGKTSYPILLMLLIQGWEERQKEKNKHENCIPQTYSNASSFPVLSIISSQKSDSF